jgi:hypothetical protein
VRNAKDRNTVEDHLEAPGVRIGEVAEEHGQQVREHTERLADGIRLDGAHAQGTGRVLGPARRRAVAIAARREGPVHEVRNETGHAQIRGALAEFDDTDQVGDGREGAGDAAERLEFLLGRLFVVGDGDDVFDGGRAGLLVEDGLCHDGGEV